MNGKHFIILALLLSQLCFSQTQKMFNGTVINEVFPISGADVINLNSNGATTTNGNGKFQLPAQYGDTLMFHSANYDLKKVVLSRDDIENNNFIINLTAKTIELEEVIVNKMPYTKVEFDQVAFDQVALERAAATLKNPFVYDGAITNGADFVRLGKDIAKLYTKIFKKNEDIVYVEPVMDFKTYVKSNIDSNFFVSILKLPPHQIALFIEFCDADADSKSKLKNINVLSIMDFLLVKNIEFQKLSSRSPVRN